MRTICFLLSAFCISIWNNSFAQVQVGPDSYAFQYTLNPDFGLFFNSSDTRYEFRDGNADPVFHINALNGDLMGMGHLRLMGDINFGPGGDLLIGANEYAFRYDANQNYGLYFNAAQTSYDFRDDNANAVFSIDASTGDITSTGVFTGDGSGLTNLPGDSDWSFSGNDIYRIGGNVGVGTSSPASPFEVNTSVGDHMAYMRNTNTGTGTKSALKAEAAFDTYAYLGIGSGTSDYDGHTGLDLSLMEVGMLGVSIGTSFSDNHGVYGFSNGNAGTFENENGNTVHLGSENYAVDIASGGLNTISLDMVHPATDDGFNFATTGGGSTLLMRTVAAGSPATRMALTEDGNFGIGTTTPDHRLEVIGTSTRLQGDLYINATAPIGSADFTLTSGHTSGYGGMVVNMNYFGAPAGTRPYYGYANNGTPEAWHFLDVDDNQTWKLHNNGIRLEVHNDGNMTIPFGPEANLTTDGFLQLGIATGDNLVLDNNEITARDNSQEAILFLNPNEGDVAIGTTGNWGTRLHVAADAGQNAFRVQTNGTTRLLVNELGQVAINTLTPAAGYELSVNGEVICEELRVQNSPQWPDYVFAEDYELRTLEEVENFIQQNHHLPEIPSASEVETNGFLVGEMDAKLLKKIEELTLYTIALKKEMAVQAAAIEALQAKPSRKKRAHN